MSNNIAGYRNYNTKARKIQTESRLFMQELMIRFGRIMSLVSEYIV